MQCVTIDAMPVAKGRRPITQHMALVPLAAAAMHLCADKKNQLPIRHGPDSTLDGFGETWPAGATVKLGLRPIKWQLATGTDERPRSFLFV